MLVELGASCVMPDRPVQDAFMSFGAPYQPTITSIPLPPPTKETKRNLRKEGSIQRSGKGRKVASAGLFPTTRRRRKEEGRTRKSLSLS